MAFPFGKRPIIITVCTFLLAVLLFGTWKKTPHIRPTFTTPTIYPTLPKSPNVTLPESVIAKGAAHIPWFNGTWDARRDARNRLLSSVECELAFPGLFAEIDRVVAVKKSHPITQTEMEEIQTGVGAMKAMIYDQQLFITQTGPDMKTRGFAMLEALNRAIVTSPERLPNIEFNFGVFDTGANSSTWYPTRLADQTNKWLAPDFGFWSWPEPRVHSYDEVRRKASMMEEGDPSTGAGAWPWHRKKPQLVWRGASLDLPAREKLVRLTEKKPWADVKLLIWNGDEKNTDKVLLSMDEHCQYKFISHTEGVSYSGRLKYIANCRSVIVMPKLEWVEHFHPLLVPEGPEQNYVEVKADYSNLEKKMKELLDDDARAERIADNSAKTFRDRYLTPAAETCYWRRLIRSWREVSYEPDFFEIKDGKRQPRGTSIEDYLLLRKLEWDPY